MTESNHAASYVEMHKMQLDLGPDLELELGAELELGLKLGADLVPKLGPELGPELGLQVLGALRLPTPKLVQAYLLALVGFVSNVCRRGL